MAKTRWKLSGTDKMNIPLEEAEKKLIGAGLELATIVKKSMGRGYGEVYKRGNIEHQASFAGWPPAVDTGRLRASISVNWTGSGKSKGEVDSKASHEDGVGSPKEEKGKFKVVVGTNVEYAPFLEFGTRKMDARPFMRPAFDEIKGRILKMLKSGTK